MNGLEKSDENFGTFLRRNFEERRQMELQIVELSPMQLYLTMEWLEPLRCKLFETIESFIRAVRNCDGTFPTSYPTAMQLIALRRLNWLAPLFQDRLDILRAKPSAVGNGIFEQCSDSISRLNWPLG